MASQPAPQIVNSPITSSEAYPPNIAAAVLLIQADLAEIFGSGFDTFITLNQATAGQSVTLASSPVGVTYFVEVDSSAMANATVPVINLPAQPCIGQQVSVRWRGWGAATQGPQVNGNGNMLEPANTGMASNELAASTVLAVQGGAYKVKYDGTNWVQAP